MIAVPSTSKPDNTAVPIKLQPILQYQVQSSRREILKDQWFVDISLFLPNQIVIKLIMIMRKLRVQDQLPSWFVSRSTIGSKLTF